MPEGSSAAAATEAAAGAFGADSGGVPDEHELSTTAIDAAIPNVLKLNPIVVSLIYRFEYKESIEVGLTLITVARAIFGTGHLRLRDFRRRTRRRDGTIWRVSNWRGSKPRHRDRGRMRPESPVHCQSLFAYV